MSGWCGEISMLRPAVAVLNGCNLNMLGQRNHEHYGTITLAELDDLVTGRAAALGFAACTCFQTNHEGAMVEKIQQLSQSVDGMIINPGAWTHYSFAIHDALELVAAPVIEVHLSDIAKRKEEWRRRSVISDVCARTISGKGPAGYLEAIGWLAERL